MRKTGLRILLKGFAAANYLLFHETGFRWANLLFSLIVAFYSYGTSFYMFRFVVLYIILIELVSKYIYTQQMRSNYYSDGLDIMDMIKEEITKSKC